MPGPAGLQARPAFAKAESLRFRAGRPWAELELRDPGRGHPPCAV